MSYVGVGLRAVAVIVDTIMLFVIMYIIAVATGNTSADGFKMEGPPAFLGFLVWFLYYVGAEATTGATLGKMLIGARVVKTDGSPVGWGPALIRNLLRIVDGLFVYLVGAIIAMRSPTKQRLGDRIAGTVVVRRNSIPAT